MMLRSPITSFATSENSHYHEMIRYRVANEIDMLLMLYQSDIQEHARLDWVTSEALTSYCQRYMIYLSSR